MSGRGSAAGIAGARGLGFPSLRTRSGDHSRRLRVVFRSLAAPDGAGERLAIRLGLEHKELSNPRLRIADHSDLILAPGHGGAERALLSSVARAPANG